MRVTQQAGNVAILVVYQCILVLLAAILCLDVVSVLYVRRAVRTAADSAALGALRAVQNEVGPLLWEKADANVKGWLKDAKAEWQRAVDDWQADHDAAKESCQTAATDEQGDVDTAGYSQCVGDWRLMHSKPVLEVYEERALSRHIGDPVIVQALLGNNQGVTVDEAVSAILTGQEQVCILLNNQASLRRRGIAQAEQYATLNGASLLSLDVPYEGRAQVYVRVQRQVPTIILSRFSKEVLVAVGEVGATLFDLKDKGVSPGGC